MRLNKYIALHSHYSRRAADQLIEAGRVLVNEKLPEAGAIITSTDIVTLDGNQINPAETDIKTIIMNKPAGYVCSRNGQGSLTIYDLIPRQYQHLNYVGRLDKDSSGLLVLTNDGNLANELTHPSSRKIKIYEVEIDKPLQPLHQQIISEKGIHLQDGYSKFEIQKKDDPGRRLQITMHEGRNRQIRRTFESLGYQVVYLHRTIFGPYSIGGLEEGQIKEV